jgi:mRNA-degrading endonuclease RelE of RelBE toxin-antitoxin system
MNSNTTDKFRKAFAELPADVQKQARQAYRLFIENPFHPSLHFKLIHPTRPIYSVRIGLDYRAVGIRDGNDIIWYWGGSHAEYDKLIRQYRK